MILSIGYRVRSPRGMQFRRFANTVLKEYLVKGFAIAVESHCYYVFGLRGRASKTSQNY